MSKMAQYFQRRLLAEDDQRATNRSWESFQVGALDDTESVRKEIHRSWMRSASAGINPERGEAPVQAPTPEQLKLQRSNRELFKAARGSLDKIGRMLDGTDAMMILTDDSGLIIEAMGDPRTLRTARKINLEVGRVWNEEAVGTNGIGTALWAGKPMFVHGTEHFVETLKAWSCAAAPIRNPLDRSIIGAVDISGLTQIFREHNTAFAAAAAGEIEAALAQAICEERIRLLDALLEQVPVLRSEDGVVVLDLHGRILHKRGADQLLYDDEPEIDLQMGKKLVNIEEEVTARSVAEALPRSLPCRGISELKIGGRIRGIALVLGNRRGHNGPARAPFIALAKPSARKHGDIVAECPAMLETIDLARRVARVDAPVLIQGETGTGKELIARLIHSEHSGTKKTPFVAINCGAFSRELFGSEMFGHVAGAFTGAVQGGKPGKLEDAHGGVFCLDEIGEMPLELQPYLLRALEERVIFRIGDNRPRPFNARLVALTNRDLREDVDAGKFRRDLYYRIDSVTIKLPPLRDRGEDILLLLEHFNKRIAENFGLNELRFSADLSDLFLNYSWPGNVRELRNLVQRLHTVSRKREIQSSDLPAEIAIPLDNEAGGPPLGRLMSAERDVILATVEKHGGNLTRVAKELGITRPTLYKKLKRYRIKREYR